MVAQIARESDDRRVCAPRAAPCALQSSAVRAPQPTRGRLRWREACLVFAAAAFAASCTLLVQFHDQPSCEGGLCGDDATAPPDAPVPVDAAPDSGDAGVARPDHYAPCSGLASGDYCATDGLEGYAGSTGDLVYCLDGGIGTVTHCDGGCLSVPAPFPDACNPCPGVPDGLYCGRNLPGFPAANADFLIQCQSGNVSQNVACQHGCKSNGTSSCCYQTTGC